MTIQSTFEEIHGRRVGRANTPGAGHQRNGLQGMRTVAGTLVALLLTAAALVLLEPTSVTHDEVSQAPAAGSISAGQPLDGRGKWSGLAH